MIFPAMAAINDTVSWDGGLDWLNQYTVKGRISLYSYTGATPTVHIWGITNSDNQFSAQTSEIGTKYSNAATCDLQGSLPLVKNWDAWVYQ